MLIRSRPQERQLKGGIPASPDTRHSTRVLFFRKGEALQVILIESSECDWIAFSHWLRYAHRRQFNVTAEEFALNVNKQLHYQ